MSTEAALLRTIRETPEDDTARLVYADLVEEEGDPARGEFIRVQIALANTPETDPDRLALEDREHDLLVENEDRWLGVPRDSDGLLGWQFVRGFVDDVSATPSFMLNEGTDLCAANPVRRWRVQSSQSDMVEDLLDAGRRGWFSRLEALDLSGWYTAIGELERFLTRSDFSRLRELNLTYRPGLDYLPGILERSPFLKQLKVLRVGSQYDYTEDRLDAAELVRVLDKTRLKELSVIACQLTAEDIRDLMMSDCCQELTSLNIAANPHEFDLESFRLARCNLRSLNVSGITMREVSFEHFLRQDSLSSLRVLNLDGCGDLGANLPALAASRYWAQAEELRIQNGGLNVNTLVPLVEAAGSPNLRTLDAAFNQLGDAEVKRICNAPWANSLRWLSFSLNVLSDESFRTIAGCERLANLRTLDLSHNNDTPDGTPATRITDAGLRALVESPHLSNLRQLNLSGLDIKAATRAAFEQRFGPNVLLEELPF